MKIITEKAIEAFLEGTDFNRDNTSVYVTDDFTYLALHGNDIARKSSVTPFGIEITTAGWDTVTTKARLNGIPGVNVYTKAGQLFLNGTAWNGDWAVVTGGK